MKKLPLKNILPYHKELSDLSEGVLERKALSPENLISEENTIVGVMSTIRCDSDGDILMPQGCDFSRYEKNSVICWNHSLDQKPLGKIENISVTDKDIRGELKFSDSYDEAVTVKNLIKEGILKTLSVGYIPVEILKRGSKEFITYAKQFSLDVSECARIITKWLIVETSVVAVPANEDALILYSGKNFMSDFMKKSLHIEDKLCGDKKPEEKEIISEKTEDNISEKIQDNKKIEDKLCGNEQVQDEPKEEKVIVEGPVNEQEIPKEISETVQTMPEGSESENIEVIPEKTEVTIEETPEAIVNTETSPVEPKQASVESEVVPPSTDTIKEEVEPKASKPLVIKVIRIGKRLSDETIKTKALRYLQGKSI